MGTHDTGIEWTHHHGYRGVTWNPLAAYDEDGNRGWFCTKVSSGCRNCYAERMNIDQPHGLGTGHEYAWPNLKEITWAIERLDKPLRWTKPRCVFVNSMTDLHHEAVPEEIINQIWATMALAPTHRFLVLTKRPDRLADYLGRWWTQNRRSRREALISAMEDIVRRDKHLSLDDKQAEIDSIKVGGRWPLPNVWLGTSAEDQETANERIPALLAAPASAHFLSAEPLIGPVSLHELEHDGTRNQESVTVNVLSGSKGDGLYFSGYEEVRKLDWVIAGGESGRNARPMHPGWARQLREECRQEDVPYFFKQWGEWCPRSAAADDCDLKKYEAHEFEPLDDPSSEEEEEERKTKAAVTYRVGRSNARPFLSGEVYQQIPTLNTESNQVTATK